MALLGAPLGVAALATAAPVAADDDDDERDDDDRRHGRSPFAAIPVTGSGAAGDFSGTFSIREFAVREGALFAIGSLSGFLTSGGKRERHRFDTVAMPATLPSLGIGAAGVAANGNLAAHQVASCPVLNLVLGPLNLDLLGLVVTLNQVVLNITAVPGTGNLLGNLLCALVGLLDGLNLSGRLAQITALLNAILALLRA